MAGGTMRAGEDPIYALVLAGGSGTRLWPASRRSRPKQLLPLIGQRSMLARSVARLAPLIPAERVFVLTGAEYVEEVRADLPDLPADQVVGEPSALGTAAALGLGMALVRARAPEALMCVVTADHLIEPEAEFQAALARAAAVARAGHLVTFGIRPTSPETGFGYVELGAALDAPRGAAGETIAHAVARFVEKPDRATAERYLAGGRHLWNSGMFAWTVPSIASAFARFLPDLAARLDEITQAAGRADFADRLPEIWSRISDRTTIDYGIMERAENVACVPAAFEWRDIGSWSALRDALPKDAAGNAVVGRHLGLDTTGCLVYAPEGRLIATIGLEDMIIVDTGDAVLVCPASRAQEVKDLVDALRSGDGERFL
jgi:mannose-1-phosphate guanylyltransferase